MIRISALLILTFSSTNVNGIDYEKIFTSGRVGMTQSSDLPNTGELHFVIGHRFGEIKGGLYDMFGLDLATIRLGFDYGISDVFAVGIGRSTWEKSYDIFSKIALMRQSDDGSPVALTGYVMASVNTLRNFYPEENDGLWNRSSLSGQLMVSRKQGVFSFQVASLFFRNNFETRLEDDLNLFAIPISASIKITKRIAFTSQYIPVFDKPSFAGDNPLSFGFDIDTGGHQFQLNFSNSPALFEKPLLTDSYGSWLKGRIYFGFNLVRVFYLH